MGTKERRQRERGERREEILKAALDIITESGFSALSMRRLAERIEYSPAHIYSHFESQDEIARELATQGFREMLAMMEEAAAGGLLAVVQAYVAFALKSPEMYRLIFMGDSDYMKAAFAVPDPDGPAAKCYSLIYEMSARELDGSDSGMTPKEMTDSIWAAAHGIVALAIHCTGFQTAAPQRVCELVTNALIESARVRNPKPRA